MTDENLSTEEKISEIAFCLGHATLHKNLNYNPFRDNDMFTKRNIDMQANKFAGKLLKLIS